MGPTTSFKRVQNVLLSLHYSQMKIENRIHRRGKGFRFFVMDLVFEIDAYTRSQ